MVFADDKTGCLSACLWCFKKLKSEHPRIQKWTCRLDLRHRPLPDPQKESRAAITCSVPLTAGDTLQSGKEAERCPAPWAVLLPVRIQNNVQGDSFFQTLTLAHLWKARTRKGYFRVAQESSFSSLRSPESWERGIRGSKCRNPPCCSDKSTPMFSHHKCSLWHLCRGGNGENQTDKTTQNTPPACR